ncbi:MAG TPA: malto-oligosyltrehalose trehalohydrolase [Alphaproteobacteria bacterium]|nr:malto-oligosyltrehalose trehalohydrolase [Alphaproteobacteria bacterium]
MTWADDAYAWGPLRRADGSVRFRLWGSEAAGARLRIVEREWPLREIGDDWHECIVPEAPSGTAYCFVLRSGLVVPDPAARAQLGDVHGPSILTDPYAYRWRNTQWQTRPWEESVYYELHVGTFTPEGTFAAATERLQHVAGLGVTTVELMPVGQFSGRHGWGYDGVLWYAPHGAYGSPDELKALVDTAHGLGLNVVLDVIYNHFGPDGNYLSAYAPAFFHPTRRSPWGQALAYERPAVRRLILDNLRYWLDEFHLDGFRFDAIDNILDDQSDTEIMVEMAQMLRRRYSGRHLHLTTEDNRNITALHRRGPDGGMPLYSGEWNDDLHNVVHPIATGETDGYYVDFAEGHWMKLARCLAEGFAYQGEPSPYAGGTPRGEPSGHLPPTAFVDFIQNHDQVGNRAFGERLLDLASRGMVETLLAMLLLSPHIPLLFMGEEWGETRPFVFFADYEGDLAEITREGRRVEFADFPAFRGDPAGLREVPDPCDPGSFTSSQIDWDKRFTDHGGRWLAHVRHLLALRRERIVPLLRGAGPNAGTIEQAEAGLVWVRWRLGGRELTMIANLGDMPRAVSAIAGVVVYASSPEAAAAVTGGGALTTPAIVVLIGEGTELMAAAGP